MRRRRSMLKYMDVTLLERRDETAEHAEMAEHAENYWENILLFRSFRVFRYFRAFCVLLLIAQGVQAQHGDKELLPDHLGQRWRAVSPSRIQDVRRLSALPDADVLWEYGLQRVISRVYTDDRVESSVEVFEMNLIPGAYGLFTFDQGQLPPNSREFHQGRYVVRISSRGADADSDRQIFEALKPDLTGGQGELPPLPMHLPEADKVAESEKYVVGPAALARLKNFSDLKDAIGFGAGAEVTTADYRSGGGQMNLIIVEYFAPESGAEGEGRVRDHFNGRPQAGEDRLIIQRLREYVVAGLNVPDMPPAANIIGQVKYQKKIYRAGRKFTDIPLGLPP